MGCFCRQCTQKKNVAIKGISESCEGDAGRQLSVQQRCARTESAEISNKMFECSLST